MLRYKRIEIDQLGKSLGNTMADPANHHACVAMPHNHGLLDVLEFEQITHIVDVRLKSDFPG